MHPTSAERARTIAAGHLPSVVVLPGDRGTHDVISTVVARGRVLVLVEDASFAAAAMQPERGNALLAGTVEVVDVPPLPGSPSHGAVALRGRIRPIRGARAWHAALAFAESHPIGDILDAGRGRSLFELEPDEVCLAGEPIEPAAWQAAEPDPLRVNEADLLTHLADDHHDLLDAIAARLRGSVLPAVTSVRPLRLDRYGLSLAGLVPDGDERRVRAVFGRPVRDENDLGAVLHPLLCPVYTPKR